MASELVALRVDLIVAFATSAARIAKTASTELTPAIPVVFSIGGDPVVEGLVENSLQHLMGSGFLLRPSDPGSNNIYIYVNKLAIANYRVLGVRALR